MATIHSENISYSANGTELNGYLAYDSDQQGPRPGVIVIHEWWGLDGYIKQRADALANLGFCGFAIDMYGGGKTADSPDGAGALMTAVLDDMASGTARLQAAYDTLINHPVVDAEKTAAIGYCFGGAMVLHMARIGMPLKAVTSFHGSLGSFHTPAPGSVKAKVLVCHGEADEFIPQTDIDNLHSEMAAAGADFRFEAYPGALHGFTSKEADANGKKYGLPLAYDAAADTKSWESMRDLFAKVFI